MPDNQEIVIEMLKHEVEYLNVTVRLVKSELEKERNHRKILQLQLKSGINDQNISDLKDDKLLSGSIDVIKDISSTLDLSELLSVFEEMVVGRPSIDGFLFNILDATKENLVCENIKLPPAYYGVEVMYKNYKFPINQFDANVHAFRDQTPITVTAAELDNYSESTKTRFERWKMESLMILPIIIDEMSDPIGTLMLFSQDGGITAESINYIEKIVKQFSTPLNNAIKYTRLKRREESIRNIEEEHLRFLRFVVEINNLNNVELIREIVCEEFLDSFGFDIAGVFMQDGNKLKCCKTVVSIDEYVDIQELWNNFFKDNFYDISLKEGSPPTCYLQNAIQHIPDVQDIIHLPMSAIDRKIINLIGTPHTMLCLPIREHYHPVGILWMFSLKKPIKLNEQQIKLIELLCVFVGAEMANAELYTTVERQNIEIEALNTDMESTVYELEEHKNNLQYLVTEKTFDITMAKNEAERANTAKSEFLANMSHELRTPLNSMLMLTKLILNDDEKNLTPNQLEYAKIIYESGQNLLQLINDILDISKAESGKMQIDLIKINIVDHIISITNIYVINAEKQNLKLFTDIEEDITQFIFSDPQRLEQVILNLLSNALKFTKEGSLTVSLFSPKQDEIGHIIPNAKAEDYVAISVVDTGIGIPKDKQSHIFEAFIQADGSISRNYGGTGLGLAICKEITSLLGGDIILDSEEGKGSTFTVYVPINPRKTDDANILLQSAEELSPKRLSSDQESLNSHHNDSEKAERIEKNGTEILSDQSMQDDKQYESPNISLAAEHLNELPILIVDNDMRNAYSLANELREKGLSIELADGCDLAISKIKGNDYINIVVVKGIENIKQIKQQISNDNIIIGADENNNTKKLIEAGANLALDYPIDGDELLSQLHQTD